ncbi:MAG TPA: SgcJ/EcaC family oxidoreductase [Thermoanaerobaculia bacterium]|nr:SgcJ/EcaC family oxidoreductase [Thermoanaerobaculia bacterium]
MGDIEQLFADWAEAVRGKDAEALAGMVTEDCEFWTHGAPALRGRGAVTAAFRKAFATSSFDQTWNEIERLSGDDFIVSVGLEVTQVTPEGGEPIVVTQRGWTLARRCEDGRWRFARGTTNRES